MGYEEQHWKLPELRKVVRSLVFLMVLLLLFQAGHRYLTPMVSEKTALYFAKDPLSGRLTAQALDMLFSMVCIFFPLLFTLIFFRGELYRPDIPFYRTVPQYPFTAIFLSLGILCALSEWSRSGSALIEWLGFPLVRETMTLPSTWGEILLYFVSSVILPAVAEEMLFRGYVLHLLLPWGQSFAVIFAAILGGSMYLHFPDPLFLACAGIILGYFTVQSGSVFIAVYIHILYNLFLFLRRMLPQILPETQASIAFLLMQGMIYLSAVFAMVLTIYRGYKYRTQFADSFYGCDIPLSKTMHVFLSPAMLLYFLASILVTLYNSFVW